LLEEAAGPEPRIRRRHADRAAAGARAAARRANPRDLGALRDSIARLPLVLAAIKGLFGLDRGFDDLADLGERLSAVLVERPPASLGDGDTIRPGADARLDELRGLRDGGGDERK